MITAHLFGKQISEGATFGGANYARALRAIADEIDNGTIWPQSAEVSSLATFDEFTSTTITLKLTEKVPL